MTNYDSGRVRNDTFPVNYDRWDPCDEGAYTCKYFHACKLIACAIVANYMGQGLIYGRLS